MTNAFAYPCQKAISRHKNEEDIALIAKDISNAYQGVVSFSKEVKKYMLGFIHARYDGDAEVSALIDGLRRLGKYRSFNDIEIFRLQDECYFWYDFLSCYAVWKIIGKTYGWADEEEALVILARLVKGDTEVFREYSEI